MLEPEDELHKRDVEAVELAEAAALDALGRPFPRPSIARLDYLASKENGAAWVYAVFMCWIDAWIKVLRDARPGISSEDLWDYANAHILTPENGGNQDAARVVRGLLLYKIDGFDEKDHASCNIPDEFDFFYEKVYRQDAEFRDECALLLLFMIKSAFVDTQRAAKGDSGRGGGI